MKTKLLLLFALFCWTTPNRAYADILEIKNKGFVNGDVVNETESVIELKDADGNLHRFLKKDVLYFEREEKKSKAAAALFKTPEKKHTPSQPPTPQSDNKKQAFSGILSNLQGRVAEQNAKIEMEKQYLDMEHEMGQRQRAIYNQAHPGTFPEADDSWLPGQPKTSSSTASKKKDFRSL